MKAKSVHSSSVCSAVTLRDSPDEARSLRLPAREAHLSFHPPHGVDPSPLAALDFGSLYGAPLVERVRVVNGWLLFDLSPAFFTALVEEINRSCPAPELAHETHAENRMRIVSRHDGAGCPDLPSFSSRADARARGARKRCGLRQSGTRGPSRSFTRFPRGSVPRSYRNAARSAERCYGCSPFPADAGRPFPSDMESIEPPSPQKPKMLSRRSC